MSNTRFIVDQPYTLVVGLGKTGMSVVRYLCRKNVNVVVTDSREQPPEMETLKRLYPDVKVYTGGFDQEIFIKADRIIASPGVPMTEKALRAALQSDVEITGDIDLFARDVVAPVIGVTGSNGKSTVTALITRMAEHAGINVAMGGNIGTPALDLLSESRELFVLELSSFQLETLHDMPMVASVILNISPDHLDRYENLESYISSKKKIYSHAKTVVVNRDDAQLGQGLPHDVLVIGFTLGQPETGDFGLRQFKGEEWLSYGEECLMPAENMKIKGRHNIANALAALATGKAAGLPMTPMIDALVEFEGLRHRTEWVAEINGVNWFNDSKGTNVGACIAAIEGLPGKHVLIAGGEGKGADFGLLKTAALKHLRAAVLIGRDATIIERAIDSAVQTIHADDMKDAVIKAAELAQPGDNVLLSPACASFDMFKNFEHRGDVFTHHVRELLK